MPNSSDDEEMEETKSKRTELVKRAKSAPSMSRHAPPGAHLMGISKKNRKSSAAWHQQAQQNVSDFIVEFKAKKAREAAVAEVRARVGEVGAAESADDLSAMNLNLAGYKRKTSKKSNKRHSSRKKHRKRRTRRH